jgi:CRP-like cAMP-binding protein
MSMDDSLQSATENRLLAHLTCTPDALFERSQVVPLRLRQVLFDIDRPITHVYFPLTGIVSVVGADLSASAVETATIGREGFVGIPIILGAAQVSAQAFCQVAGRALQIPVDVFREALAESRELETALKRYVLAFLSQTAQTSVCNRLHTMRERCARWLLETHDRVDGDMFGLTQEFLAQMLGVRRATVGKVATELQDDGLIQYEYRQITITNRPGLERAACACYRIITLEYERLVEGRYAPSLFEQTVSAHEEQTSLSAPLHTADRE